MDNSVKEKLDLEWVDLMKEALELGLSKKEIRRFLVTSQKRTEDSKMFVLKKRHPFLDQLSEYKARVSHI
ncbi:anti-repressor SinI family protein [Alkalihalobacterium chitinilyticum]|uniref:Anti-repressor SinI family protein n=1 Tax=Alkalihalobacterium chitinilyticum TaxID=2980103 RepID=A0ABT5VGF3_9BACI|nr:anti-repressor SinI family protein [Alkalihalobacterium chitinilyticum]MDE5413817.1 anti-repressor SinI family protein [Alkalihalobacterium chitinilyticum]